jgi:hypothetical protein
MLRVALPLLPSKLPPPKRHLLLPRRKSLRLPHLKLQQPLLRKHLRLQLLKHLPLKHLPLRRLVLPPLE